MLCFTVPAMAQDKSSIEIIQPYAFATTSAARSAAAFMVIQNNTNADDRLIEAASSISEITEIHQNLIDPDDGTMMMRKIKGLDIPANAAATLEPKGYHIMFIKMNERLKIGETVSFDLTFEKAGTITVTADIIAPGTKPKSKSLDEVLNETTGNKSLEKQDLKSPKEKLKDY